MPTLRTKIKKLLLLISTGVAFLLAFIYDVINWSVNIDSGWLGFFRDAIVVTGFVFLYFLIHSLWKRDQSPVKKLGFTLVLTLILSSCTGILSFVVATSFDAKNYILIPQEFGTIVLANVFGVVLGSMAVIVLLLLRDIIFAKRRKGTVRNFLVLVGTILATAFSTFMYRPLESGVFTNIIFGFAIAAMLVNSFRLSWIVYLSKREKLYSMAYGFFLFLFYIGIDILVSGGMPLGKSLLFYSPALKSFISTVSLFGTIYFGMTFVSTLFHLPTAEAFDRKISEVSSLHNLSKLVTQVFDFNELVDSVTKMTLEVCEAKSSWLEIINETPSGFSPKGLLTANKVGESVEIVAHKNISKDETLAIVPMEADSLRREVLATRTPIVIDDFYTDRRTKGLPKIKSKFSSMVIVPLQSHDKVIGILYATKEMAFGFDKDDVDVISAFADQATIAIENSRLIEKSLERERLVREMMVAQDMQKRLLPPCCPNLKEVDLEALSTPAFEVGGDYYDFTMLDEFHLGIVVGDVSGKGVSAAFYMAEMKGIFQSLSKIYHSPKEFLSKAHAALSETIDKRSFISLIYAVLDLRTGMMTVARAGHCPLLYVSKNNARYVKPTGLGLGMGSKLFFEQTIMQEEIQLSKGDVAVFYTDGVTEAHPKDGLEFGYEQLLDVAKTMHNTSALEVRDAIIMAVDKHMIHEPPEDDLTLVVLKWRT